MKARSNSKNRFYSMGSVMEIWPAGDYSEYMPQGTDRQRLGQHWQRIGDRLDKALTQYERTASRT